MKTTPAMPELPDGATVLPDGSAFAIASFPLPSDHWLYAPREYRDGEEEPIELPSPILSHQAHGDVVRAAIRYAVRSATMCGKEPDFDPDALVQNAMYALCGPFGGATLQAQPAAKCDGNHGGPRCADPECWNDDPQAQPAAEVSDDDLQAIDDAHNWQTLKGRMAAYRAILALRPQSESEARRAAQEQLYTERERHTAEVKRLQTEIGRLQSLRPQAVPMTEDEFVACLTKANCIGVVKMSYDSGPYGITRPSINASKLKEAFEAHHGITVSPDTSAPAGGEGKA